MNSRERVRKAIHFGSPDRVPIRNQVMDAALHEHGRKLPDLYRTHPGDFGDPAPAEIPGPRPEDILPDGSYRRVETDSWGVEWEFLKFGIMGHPLKRPLDRIENLAAYWPPAPPAMAGAAFAAEKEAVRKLKETSYCLRGWLTIFETLHSVRNFEAVLMDVMDDAPAIHALADLILDYRLKEAEYHLALGADGIMLADDWGTQRSLLIGKDAWRSFFKPRYAKLIRMIKAAGADVFFHSCGHILPLLPDLAELGVDVFWPQMSAHDHGQLAEAARRHHLCLELHMDRQQLMTFGTPAQIDAAVAAARKTFGRADGGILWHAEIDNGFPFENIQALLAAFQKYA